MDEASDRGISMDSLVTEMLLGKLALKFYPQHLHRFATILVGLEDAEFSQIEYNAGQDAWRRVFSVLQTWYRRPIERRTIRDLSLLLEEAERLGFVQKGTHDDLINGKLLETKYLEKSHTGPYPDFREMLTTWYTDIDWQNLLLFPWMDEDALLLSEAYTDLEMDKYSGRGIKAQTVPIKHYSEVFKERKPEGTRILLKGDPGTGKTTFTHKLAFDWATGQLDLFDNVFVIKLKFADKTQTIENMIKNQIGSIDGKDIGEATMGEYLKSGRDRVLLVLDGLDDIKVKNYPNVLEVLQGKAYRKCSTLVTTRPFVAHDIENKMTTIAKIKGFSEERASQFLSHILPEEERKEFFSELKKKKMTDLQNVPLIIQALALLFKEDKELPTTFTMTYDQLVFFLQKTCEATKDLSEEDIQEAMAEVAEIAFKGLTREDKQLVFSRNEIKNENIYKLGILTAEKAGSGFKPTTILQFPHKTFQENSAADFVTTRLQEGDRRPWDKILKQFQALKHETRDPTQTLTQPKEAAPDSDDNVVMGLNPDEFSEHLAEIERVSQRVHSSLEAYFHAAQQQKVAQLIDSATRSKQDSTEGVSGSQATEPSSGTKTSENFHQEIEGEISEQSTNAATETHPAVPESTSTVPPTATEESPSLSLPTLQEMQNQPAAASASDLALWDIVGELKLKARSVIEDAKNFVFHVKGLDLFDPETRKNYVSLVDNYAFLMERVESYKTLFSFIVGKLPEEAARQVLLEIAHVVVQNAVEETLGSKLPTRAVRTFLEGLAREKLPEDDVTATGSQLFWPALLNWDWLEKDGALEYIPTGKQVSNGIILDIKSSQFNHVTKEFLQGATKQLNSLKGVLICQLADVLLNDLPDHVIQQFGSALYTSPLLSLELLNVDQRLVKPLLERLPPSLRHLTLFNCQLPAGHQLMIPPFIQLASLTIDSSSVKIQHLFASMFLTVFPKLKVFVFRYSHMDNDDVTAFSNALKAGRLPQLQEIAFSRVQFTGHGQALAEILSCPHLLIALFEDTALGLEDGELILQALLDGALDHLHSLRLINNPEVEPLEEVLKDSCHHRGISLKCFTYDKMMDINRAMPFLASLHEKL